MPSNHRPCAHTGRPIEGKAYVLKTTEGEEFISPDALFHTKADEGLGDLLTELQDRIRTLEDNLTAAEKERAVPAQRPAPTPRKR